MATDLSRIKAGSTKEMALALHRSIKKDATEKEVLEDMHLARIGSGMIQSTGRLEILSANLKTLQQSATKIPVELSKQCDDLQKEITNCITMRGSLERQFLEHSTKPKSTKDLTEKMITVTKLNSTLENKAKDTIEKLFQFVPGKNLDEVRRMLNPESEKPHYP